jgi:DNA-binding CsgD family transcriptional regulator
MRRWTRGEDELARELVADGYTAAEIAAEVGRGVPAVYHRLHLLGAGRGCGFARCDADLRARVLGLVAAGVGTGAGLAAAVGRSKKCMCELLRRLERDGLVRRSGSGRWRRWRVSGAWTRDDDAGRDEARELSRGGLTPGEIAKRLGRSKKGVQKWLAGGVT